MAQRAKSKVGQTLGRTYRIERLLGVGSVGAVYVARHLRTGALCAVKVLHRKVGPTGEAYGRFMEETRTIGLLRHPHILPFSDFDHDESGALYLVMDLLEGENLQQRLQHKGGLPLSQALDLAKQAGGALHAAHRSGVLHRNVRPENLFLVRHDLGDHMTESARVMDFGLGRLRRPPGAEVTGPEAGGDPTRGTLLGLSQYTAPEVALSPTGAMDARADQWGLAVVLYRALAGRLPFEGESLRDMLRHMTEDEALPLAQAAPELPEHVARAVMRGMARDPKERFDTVMDLVRAVNDRPSLASGVMVTPSPSGIQARPPLLIAAARDEAPRPASGPAPPVQEPQGARQPRARGLWFAGGAMLLLASSGATVWLMHRPPAGTAVVMAAQAAAEPALALPSTLAPPQMAEAPVAEPAAAAPTPEPAAAAPSAGTPTPSAGAPTPAVAVAALPPRAEEPPRDVLPEQSTPSQPPSAPSGPPSTPSGPLAAPSGSPSSRSAPPDGRSGPPSSRSGPLAAPSGSPAAPSRGAGGRPARTEPADEPPRTEDPEAQGRSADEILREAQTAYTEGDRARAISLALSATGRPGDTLAAWRFLGTAACQEKDGKLATRAYRHLGAADKQFVLGVCQRQGMDYLDNEFRPDPWP